MSTSRKLRVIQGVPAADQGRSGVQFQTESAADIISIASHSLGASDDELATLLNVPNEQIAAWRLESHSAPYLVKLSLVLACSCVTILGCGKDEIFAMSDMAQR